MVGALEDLALLRDGVDDRLQRRTAIGVAERVGADLVDDRLEAAPDRAEVLDALLPQEPGSVGGAGVLAPMPDQVADPGVVQGGVFRPGVIYQAHRREPIGLERRLLN